MFKIRISLVFLHKDKFLLENNSLPSFFLFPDDVLEEKLLAFGKEYFKYDELWFDFNLVDFIQSGNEFNIVYSVFTGDDNLKGIWNNVQKTTRVDLQQILYKASISS